MSKPVEPIVIVGSGASAVHFARTLLEKGYRVRMLDVGRRGPTPVHASASFAELKQSLDDPAAFFLGEQFEDVAFPREGAGYSMRWPWLSKQARDTPSQDTSDSLHGFSHHFAHVFGSLPNFPMKPDGFAPIVSFAQGGLAEAWAAGAFAFNSNELAAFPFSYADIEPFYDLVAQRIGISGVHDDLADFNPVHRHLQPPLELNDHAAVLLKTYESRRDSINERLGCFMGRSRAATLTEDIAGRQACSYLGRCLWGCPTESIYAPRFTLRECQQFEQFEYLSGWYVSHFCLDQAGRITSVVAVSTESQREERFDVGTLVLGAGTIATSRIVLESIYRDTGQIERLTGLMDTRMLLIPFINPGMLCKPCQMDAYQYHQLAIAIRTPQSNQLAHGQITTMTGTAVHAAVQNIGFDLKTSLFVFRHARSAMGLVMVALHDERREENYLTLQFQNGSAPSRLVAHYRSASTESERIRWTVRRIVGLLRKLGCVAARRKVHVRPMGTGIHYAGTLPMSTTSARLCVSPHGHSWDFENLYVIDGSTFPFLPGKGLTFTLMANAARIADQAF